jgi:predicted  nucleic acid-binding Zn-ribbon protein
MQANVAQMSTQIAATAQMQSTLQETERSLREQLAAAQSELSTSSSNLTQSEDRVEGLKTSCGLVQSENRALSMTLSEIERLVENMATDQV